MFDLSSALILGLVLVGLVSLVRTLVHGPGPSRLSVAINLVVSVVAVQLVAASDFAGEQVVLERPLNGMNFASQLVISLLLAGAGSGIWEGYSSIKNIGQNQQVPPTPAPLVPTTTAFTSIAPTTYAAPSAPTNPEYPPVYPPPDYPNPTP